MKAILRVPAACFLVAAIGIAHAQYATIEDAAAVTEDNVTRFES